MIDKDPVVDRIFRLLREWRAIKADNLNVPRYIIHSDKRLRDFARTRDISRAAWLFLTEK